MPRTFLKGRAALSFHYSGADDIFGGRIDGIITVNSARPLSHPLDFQPFSMNFALFMLAQRFTEALEVVLGALPVVLCPQSDRVVEVVFVFSVAPRVMLCIAVDMRTHCTGLYPAVTISQSDIFVSSMLGRSKPKPATRDGRVSL